MSVQSTQSTCTHPPHRPQSIHTFFWHVKISFQKRTRRRRSRSSSSGRRRRSSSSRRRRSSSRRKRNRDVIHAWPCPARPCLRLCQAICMPCQACPAQPGPAWPLPGLACKFSRNECPQGLGTQQGTVFHPPVAPLPPISCLMLWRCHQLAGN